MISTIKLIEDEKAYFHILNKNIYKYNSTLEANEILNNFIKLKELIQFLNKKIKDPFCQESIFTINMLIHYQCKYNMYRNKILSTTYHL